MADEVKLEQPAAEPVVKKDTRFKKGESGNPLGRTPGVKTTKSKRLSLYAQLWGRADAPDDWFGDSLKLMKKQGLTVDELIIIRAKYCLANNIKYQNTALLEAMFVRAEGKVPLRVLHKPGEDGDNDELDALTDAELAAYVEGLEQRAKLAAAKTEQEKATAPELTEGTDGGQVHEG